MKNEYFQNVDSTRKMYKYMNMQLALLNILKGKTHCIAKENQIYCNKAIKTFLGWMSYESLCNVWRNCIDPCWRISNMHYM